MILITLIPKSVAIGKIIRLSAGINKKKKKIVQNNLAGIVYICTYCWEYRIPHFRGLIDAILLWGNKIRDLLVLVGSDGGEDSLREAECLNPLPTGHRLVWRQFAAEVLPDDVDTRLILVHGVEDDLKKYERTEGEVELILLMLLVVMVWSWHLTNWEHFPALTIYF